MNDKLLEVMPEFKHIQDAGLRDKAMTVWTEAMKEARWSFDDLKEMPFTLLIKSAEVNLVAHVHEEKTRMKPMRRIDPEGYCYDGPPERKLP